MAVETIVASMATMDMQVMIAAMTSRRRDAGTSGISKTPTILSANPPSAGLTPRDRADWNDCNQHRSAGAKHQRGLRNRDMPDFRVTFLAPRNPMISQGNIGASAGPRIGQMGRLIFAAKTEKM
jgi:hypothetical protein